MRKKRISKKSIIQILLLIIVFSNFGFSFAYWASTILADQSTGEASVQVGQWDFEDTAAVVAAFQQQYQAVLSLTTETVTITDKPEVEAALAAYGLLSAEAKTQLQPEKDLLDALLAEIIAFENSVFLDFENNPFENGLTGTLVIDGRTWFGNDIFIAGDPVYDVWIGLRSLALRQGAYFESRDFFINGIDRITLYHGALNFNNGNTFQFRIEYELASNPGVWVILESGGTDLIIDVISGDPLTFTSIDVGITEAMNIRFVPILSATGDYINLDDIRIFEHVVASNIEAITFRTVYQNVLALDVGTVTLSDQEAITNALNAYDLLSLDAQTELSPEKALLDSLEAQVTILAAIAAAEQAVTVAESSNTQADVDAAQALVTALPASTTKDQLQLRLNAVQDIIDQVALFRTNNAYALSLDVGTVTISDQAQVQAALDAYYLLSAEVRAELLAEEALLLDLLEAINNQIPTATQVANFRSDHAYVLGLTTSTVAIADQAQVVLALAAYDVLSEPARIELLPEKVLLDSLLATIEVLIATEAVVIAETSFLQADLNAAQVLVSALPNGPDKTSLQQRLDNLQIAIDTQAANQVDALITALPTAGDLTISDQTAITNARNAYNALTSVQQALVQNEALLTTLEGVIADLMIAENAVVVAESSNLQADVDAAIIVVTPLPEGAAKQDLTNRLNTVQDIIDVNTAQALILSYFASNTVTVSNLNNNTIKQNNFLADANSVVSGLGVTITVQSSNRISRTNTIYTISIVKNGASATTQVSVTFIRG